MKPKLVFRYLFALLVVIWIISIIDDHSRLAVAPGSPLSQDGPRPQPDGRVLGRVGIWAKSIQGQTAC